MLHDQPTPAEQAQIQALQGALNQIVSDLQGMGDSGLIFYPPDWQNALNALDSLGEPALFQLTGGQLGETQFVQLQGELKEGLANPDTIFPPCGSYVEDLGGTINTYLNILVNL